jgi:GWxTD domain-containing protein
MQKLQAALLLLLVSIIASPQGIPGADTQKNDPWKVWLDEVRPIMTKSEEAVFKSLRTEEDRMRFQQLFWRLRDPDPATPENEFRKEYYARLSYAEKRLNGAGSDRGRVYLLLGKPTEKYDFSGSEKVVDCELWVYQNTGLPGLPPMLDLIFYRENNVGDLKLYYPGANSPLDVLSTSYMRGSISRAQAYKIISVSLPELGRASLSVIPSEANAGMSSLDSGTVLSQVFSLPERQFDRSYLRNFGSAEGLVDVSASTKEIAGKAAVGLSRDRGFRFLNCAILPGIISTVKGPDGVNRARVVLGLRIEDLKGTTIHQQERPLDLKFDEAQKRSLLEEQKLVFNDFAPIVDGEFNAYLTFMNRTSDEFFVHKERITVSPETVALLSGYRVQDAGSDRFLPFRDGAFKVSLDPRALFTGEDSLEGLVASGSRPEVALVSKDDPKNVVSVTSVENRSGSWVFTQPLKDVRPGNYTLRVRLDGREVAGQALTVLSFKIERPVGFDRSEPAAASSNYDLIVAQEHLNLGEVDRALESLSKLPQAMWNATTLPVIARAHYLKKDYAKVLELLGREIVVKTYPVLLMLGNACLETKDLRQAAAYFELVRKYGDTADNNRVLGAIYYSLGERERAQTYWDRAKTLEQKSAEKSPGPEKEERHG